MNVKGERDGIRPTEDMTYQGYGRVIKGVGGLFTVRMLSAMPAGEAPFPPAPLDGKTVTARGRGSVHRKGAILVGDVVELSYDDTSFFEQDGHTVPSPDGTGIAIDRILERSSALIRPPMANLDVLFVTLAAAAPDPILLTVDKLISIAEHNRIEVVVVVTKSDLAPAYARELAALYEGAGFSAFCIGRDMEDDTARLDAYIKEHLPSRVAAFSGASGVGKSTLLNRLFPALELETGEISHRIERGKNTTRRVELYPLSDEEGCGFLADTPGFTMLDFERFDFFDKEDLPEAFREFRPYFGGCRYTKCSHTKEQGCAILDAVRTGAIARSRHESFVSLYDVLKNKTKW